MKADDGCEVLPVAVAVSPGSACTDASDCATTGAICSGTCQCAPTALYDDAADACVRKCVAETAFIPVASEVIAGRPFRSP